MKHALYRLGAYILISLFLLQAEAQPESRITNKPYKILTSGRQVTVKSNKNIRNIMVWTASGHRVVEQKGVNAPNYTFNVTMSNEKAFFVMIQYESGKPFTEKIGIR